MKNALIVALISFFTSSWEFASKMSLTRPALNSSDKIIIYLNLLDGSRRKKLQRFVLTRMLFATFKLMHNGAPTRG